jgi:hypothetical protein
MIAMKTSLLTTLLAGALSFIPTLASAATITVVHGINGRDLGLPRALPVDIAVNGSCALSNVTFGASTQVELPQGTYQVTVHPSTGDCSSAPVINQQVSVPEGVKNVGLVAQIADSGSPQLQAFVNDSEPGFIVVNNASRGPKIFAGSGLRGWIFYYANPLGNGQGKAISGFGKNRRLQVVLVRINQRRPFYNKTIKAGSTAVLYVVGSRKNGQLVVEERIG